MRAEAFGDDVDLPGKAILLQSGPAQAVIAAIPRRERIRQRFVFDAADPSDACGDVGGSVTEIVRLESAGARQEGAGDLLASASNAADPGERLDGQWIEATAIPLSASAPNTASVVELATTSEKIVCARLWFGSVECGGA